jgi:hypothetical protein
MAAIAQAELADVLQLDKVMSKAELEEKFQARAAAAVAAQASSGGRLPSPLSPAIDEETAATAAADDMEQIQLQMLLSKDELALLLMEDLDAHVAATVR